MLDYDQIDVSEGIDVNKTPDLHECDICHYLYFLKINFRFHPKVCDGCHNLSQKAMNFNDVAIFFVKVNDCKIHFWNMSNVKAINLHKFIKKC